LSVTGLNSSKGTTDLKTDMVVVFMGEKN
jgi:hypothetical protein